MTTCGRQYHAVALVGTSAGQNNIEATCLALTLLVPRRRWVADSPRSPMQPGIGDPDMLLLATTAFNLELLLVDDSGE